ncbi:MAG: DUF427 domain-containing protein [Thermodesulfobacteriota bacterium]
MNASWNNQIIADSDLTIIIEGNHYFPPDSVNMEYLVESTTTTVCPWKGDASYFDIVVEDDVNKDAAWYYPEPKVEAKEIKGYIAFWRGVKISE